MEAGVDDQQARIVMVDVPAQFGGSDSKIWRQIRL